MPLGDLLRTCDDVRDGQQYPTTSHSPVPRRTGSDVDTDAVGGGYKTEVFPTLLDQEELLVSPLTGPGRRALRMSSSTLSILSMCYWALRRAYECVYTRLR